MRVVAIESPGGDVYSIEPSTLIVYDQYENPIVVIGAVGEGAQMHHVVSKIGDADFQRALEVFGIRRLVIPRIIKPPRIGQRA